MNIYYIIFLFNVNFIYKLIGMESLKNLAIISLLVSLYGLGNTQQIAQSLENPGKKISIRVKDAIDKAPLPHFLIDFTSCGHSKYESNETGFFSMEAYPGFSCYVMISHSGYTPTEILLEYREIIGNEKNYNVFLSRSSNRFSGTIKDKSNPNYYIQDVSIELKNSKANEIQREYSNSAGVFSVLLRPDTEYEIQFNHPKYHPHIKYLTTGKKIDSDFLGIWYLEPLPGRDLSKTRQPLVVKDKNKQVERNDRDAIFSIQVYATSFEINDPGNFQDILSVYGNVSFNKKDGITRVKVGRFPDRGKAERTLEKIRAETKFADAFLTQELDQIVERQPAETSELSYYIRLASYLNPEYFQPGSLKGLGEIMEVHKEEWTIFLLAEYESIEGAREALHQVISGGFGAAEIVYFDGGVIRKAQY